MVIGGSGRMPVAAVPFRPACVLPYPAAKRLAHNWGNCMFDAADARRLMVEGQVRTADVTDPDLHEAMLTLPRERFLPPALAPLAYMDSDIPLGNGRALLKPMVLAKLIQAAEVAAGTVSSMWAARLVTPRPCWRGLPARWSRSEETRTWPGRRNKRLRRSARQRRGRDRAVDGGMAGRRALRRDFARWRRPK